METVVVLTRLGWIVPRVVAIAMSAVWLFGLGWMGPRVLRNGQYCNTVRIGYLLGVFGFFVVSVAAALTL